VPDSNHFWFESLFVQQPLQGMENDVVPLTSRAVELQKIVNNLQDIADFWKLLPKEERVLLTRFKKVRPILNLCTCSGSLGAGFELTFSMVLAESSECQKQSFRGDVHHLYCGNLAPQLQDV
jgi:hypothetical protein